MEHPEWHFKKLVLKKFKERKKKNHEACSNFSLTVSFLILCHETLANTLQSRYCIILK